MKETNPEQRLTLLEQRHRALDEQIDRIGRRAYLTPDEQRQVTDLKKMKLATKDQLYALRRVTY
jgi:uncharacterized protein YdcH (DUF465 family)